MGTIGGGGEAMLFAIGCLAYFPVASLMGSEWSASRNLKPLILMLLGGCLLYAFVVSMRRDGLAKIYMGLYGRPLWFTTALAITLCLHPGRTQVLTRRESMFWYVVAGGWWNRPVHREYYFTETERGELLWLYYDRARRRWFLQGRIE